jgi:murein DD-endopeptidase MepM/ murein hydrolase activator NlpD
VTTGGRHDGYLAALKPPTSYPQWMEHAMRGANDPRIHSWQPFTYDFSHPWSSFDVREVDEAFVAWGWKGFDPAPIVPIPPDPTPEPPDPTPVPGKFVHPLPHGSYSITQRFNETETNPNGHEGTDFGAAGGTPVICLTDGIVAFTGVDADYGNYVRVYHDACKLHSFYAHMSRIDVHQGEAVQAGMVLGAVGSTGNSTGPHLHFETRLGNASVYSDAAPKAKGRCDPESVCAMFGLNLATGELEEIAQAQVWLPIVTTY